MKIFFSKTNNLITLAVIGAAFLGGNAAFAKLSVEQIPPFSLVFFRFLISFIFLAPFLLKNKIKIGKNIISLSLMSLLSTANIFLFAFGIKHTTANIGQILYVAVPIVSTILAYFLLKEKIGLTRISGILIGFIGTIIIILIPVISTSVFKGSLAGNILITLGAVSYSFYTILSKSFQKQYSPFVITFFFFLVTTIISFFFSLTDLITYPSWYLNVSTNSILALIYLAVFGTVIYYLLYQYIIKHSSPVTASTTLYIQPIATVIWAYFLLGEQLTIIFVVGAILTLAGTWITTHYK